MDDHSTPDVSSSQCRHTSALGAVASADIAACREARDMLTRENPGSAGRLARPGEQPSPDCLAGVRPSNCGSSAP